MENELLLLLAEAQRVSKDGGSTLDLSDKRIKTVTQEVIDIMRDRVSRLALGHNLLTSLPKGIESLSRLRYLNIRSNYLREFPAVLCGMPSLEILDISRNKIRYLPREPGSLLTLKVLSISKNRIERLPGYMSKMAELRILKLDHNPIVYPAREVTSFEGGDDAMDEWLSALRQHLLVYGDGQVSSSDGEDDDVDLKAPPPIPSKNMHRNGSKSVSAIRGGGVPMAIERSRSNSGGQHTRGFSQDFSGSETATDPQQNSRAYFRRLSSLPQSKRISLSTARVVESSRGMLFSLSQIQQAVRQYVAFCADPQLAGSLNRVLYNANSHIGALVGVLETHEAKPDGAEATPVLEACRACVGAFRAAVKILHTRLEDITSQADIRYTRTLLLLLYGAAAEIQNSWAALRSSAPRAPLRAASLGSFSAAPPSSSMSSDEQLFDKIEQATTATLSLLSLLGDAISKSALASAQGPMTPGAVSPALNIKLRELASNALSAGEVTRRLKNKLAGVELLRVDAIERRKFAEDTSFFVKAVINVAALAKSVSSEYPFSKTILASLSIVTRSTKELTILFSVSSFQAKQTAVSPSRDRRSHGSHSAVRRSRPCPGRFDA
ncbi:RAM signaling network component [Savitreella phatthalungensis]